MADIAFTTAATRQMRKLSPDVRAQIMAKIEADAAEDEVANRIIAATQLALKEGREILLPQEVANRLISGENPVVVIREWRNVSPADLASAADISPAQLTEIEQGRRSMTADLQKRLARNLNVPPDVLLD